MMQALTTKFTALAVSGGVDSMALAYLCTQIRPTDAWIKVPDHPVSSPLGLIVDHGLREGSAVEADKVATALKKLGIRAHILKLRWKEALGHDANPSQLPNVETLARYLRYRRLGAFCTSRSVASLFTAHHQDDQYETVMMRLLSGHGHRGLQGMRPATDIPECYDLHGIYQSGFIDDQRSDNPFYNLTPNERERKLLRSGLRNEVDPAVIAREIEAGLKWDVATAYLDDYRGGAKAGRPAPLLAPLQFEDGGIMVYRPLLGFGKDRLIATCLEHDIPWFEDHTNADRTLTMRNAVRYMHRGYTLPAALQKPSILQLQERCRARVASAEAEVDRLLSRVRIHEFGANAGTLVATVPRFSLPTVPRKFSASPATQGKRLAHYRHIAALLIRRLLSMVSPERELSQPAQLTHLVSMLFPSLATTSTPPQPPKPYVICSVLFTPLLDTNRWLLTRAPHASNTPPPSLTFPPLPITKRLSRPPRAWKTQGWTVPLIYDGRFWIRLMHRLPSPLRVAPFALEHHKPFREALADDGARKELAGLLRRYAPGKTRYTLPAVYATMDVAGLLAGGGWWLDYGCATANAANNRAELSEDTGEEEETRAELSEDTREEEEDELEETEAVARMRSDSLGAVHAGRVKWERSLPTREEGMQLLALPTLGVGLPGLEDWLRWEVMYRKVDDRLLRLNRLGGRGIGRRELRDRVRWLNRWTRLRLGRASRPRRSVGD